MHSIYGDYKFFLIKKFGSWVQNLVKQKSCKLYAIRRIFVLIAFVTFYILSQSYPRIRVFFRSSSFVLRISAIKSPGWISFDKENSNKLEDSVTFLWSNKMKYLNLKNSGFLYSKCLLQILGNVKWQRIQIGF